MSRFVEGRFPTDDLHRAVLEVISGGHPFCMGERGFGVWAYPLTDFVELKLMISPRHLTMA